MEAEGFTQDGTVDLEGRLYLRPKLENGKPVLSSSTGYEVFERMAFYGVQSNLVNFLTTQLHEDTVASVRNVNNWSGALWITPLLGAYIADTYMGRFWTFTVSSLIFVMGASGTKPNISTFGADQFDDFDPQEKNLKASFLNWWMFSSFIGALCATLGLEYIQENLGWGLGYGIPSVGLLFSLFIFYLGTPIYGHKVRKTKSPARDLIRVPIAAFRNRKLQLPTNSSQLHEFELQDYIRSGKRQVHHTPVSGSITTHKQLVINM